MRNSDLKCINSKMSSEELMYRAAYGVYKSYNWSGLIGIFCGNGNNGGDGYALATILKDNGYYPEIILLNDKFSDDGVSLKTMPYYETISYIEKIENGINYYKGRFKFNKITGKFE